MPEFLLTTMFYRVSSQGLENSLWKLVSFLCADPLQPSFLFDPAGRAINAHNDATQDFIFTNFQPNDCICALYNSFFHKSVDRLITGLVDDRSHASRFTPTASEITCEVLDKRLGVFARSICCTVDWTEDTNNAITG